MTSLIMVSNEMAGIVSIHYEIPGEKNKGKGVYTDESSSLGPWDVNGH